MCFRQFINKLIDGPFGWVGDVLEVLCLDPLEDPGAILICLFVLLVGVGIGMAIMIIARMM